MNPLPLFPLLATRTTTKPIVFFFLVLPWGISAGFVSITLPFLLTEHGFSVATAASITAIGLSTNIWRFALAPLADLTLSLHQWYGIGISLCGASLFVLCLIPLDNTSTLLLTLLVFLSQLAATFVVLPVGGFMAKTVAQEKQGRAAGWHQAGYLGGMGLGGGAGLWLSTHFSYQLAGVILSLATLSCAAALYFVPQVYSIKDKLLRESFKLIVLDFKQLMHSPMAVFTLAVAIMPIAIGAASYVWSSIAKDWQVKADTVALVTGAFSAGVSAIGSVLGGWISDKLGRWWALFGSGMLMATVTIIMSYTPFIPASYIGGVLVYALTVGMGYAAFSALVLHVIGQNMASTKFALFSSFGSLPPVYLAALDGWVHDRYGVRMMLLAESFLAIGFILLSLVILSKLKQKLTQASTRSA